MFVQGGYKPGKLEKLRENVKCVTKSLIKKYSIKFFSLELLREKCENALEISGEKQGIWLVKNVTTQLYDIVDLS